LAAAWTLVACNTPSPESGPTDEVVKKAVIQELGKGSSLTADRIAFSKIEHGERMQSNGEGHVPQGTDLYPIRVIVIIDKGSPETQVWYFYQNEFREWKVKA
jgi:hypothetical protein